MEGKMTIKEAITCLKADKEYLVDYDVCDGEEIDIAIELMKKQLNNCNNCRYGEQTSGGYLYCSLHSYYISLCKDWEGKRE